MVGHLKGPREPIAEEGEGDAVATPPIGDALAEGDDLARSVGERNQAIGCGEEAIDDEAIAEVERGGADARARGPGGNPA